MLPLEMQQILQSFKGFSKSKIYQIYILFADPTLFNLLTPQDM